MQLAANSRVLATKRDAFVDRWRLAFRPTERHCLENTTRRQSLAIRLEMKLLWVVISAPLKSLELVDRSNSN